VLDGGKLTGKVHGVTKALDLTGFFSNYPTQQIMDAIFAFLSEKELVPAAGSVYDFKQIQEAVTAQDEGGVNGKIVVTV